jgi:C4-dicarboxylate-specific signal transduction histidine kinase
MNSEGHHGLGIGLTLARKVIDDAGGRLSYGRHDPTGSTFLIELPSCRPTTR